MRVHWSLKRLQTCPRRFPAPHVAAPDVRALFYEGEPWQGRPTRVFAWYGAPPHARGERLPAMLLVHGGGGTAFADWVRLWNSRGYAALAMDTCGGVPTWNENPFYSPMWPRHAHSGPNGWGCFEDASKPPRNQWMYHAVAAVIRGHSLLRTLPAVDPARIGITGVSWGGILACVAAGLDSRFRFAVPVYGCGFLDGDPAGLYDAMPPRRWFELWDPQHYLPRAAMPFLWVNGTNDFAFPLGAYQQSYRSAPGPRTLAIRVRMPHGHGGAGESPEELRVFADAHLRGGTPLPRITAQGRDWVEWDSPIPVKQVEFNFTRATGYWPDRTWNTLPATVQGNRATATIPRHCTAHYFNVIDARACIVSSEHVTTTG